MTPTCSHSGCKRKTRDGSNLCWQHRNLALSNVAAKQKVPDATLSGPASALVQRSGDSGEYYRATEEKHFRADTPGSTFTEPGVTDLDKLLEYAELQRGSLEGDDRDEFIALGSPPDAFRDGVRYLHVVISGRVGVLHSAGLDPSTPVRLVRKHESAAVTPVVVVTDDPVSTDATIIIGPDDDGSEVLYTAHPGVPTPSYPRDDDPLAPYDGAEVPLSVLRKLTGGELWVNTQVSAARQPS